MTQSEMTQSRQRTSRAIPGFSAIKMKQEIQEQIYEEIKDLTPEEQVAYFNMGTEAYRA